jgi:SpoIIAA-like
MIERIAGLPANAIGFRAKGKVTAKDYENELIPAVEALFARERKVRLLCQLGPEFEGFESAAVWDDAKLGLRHLGGWERVAIVTDVQWIRVAAKVFALVMPGHVRTFDNRDFAAAVHWIGA